MIFELYLQQATAAVLQGFKTHQNVDFRHPTSHIGVSFVPARLNGAVTREMVMVLAYPGSYVRAMVIKLPRRILEDPAQSKKRKNLPWADSSFSPLDLKYLPSLHLIFLFRPRLHSMSQMWVGSFPYFVFVGFAISQYVVSCLLSRLIRSFCRFLFFGCSFKICSYGTSLYEYLL